jgi:hypothetical protein
MSTLEAAGARLGFAGQQGWKEGEGGWRLEAKVKAVVMARHAQAGTGGIECWEKAGANGGGDA